MNDFEQLSSGNSFAEKVALVTGAASGLGRATALAFARNGAVLCLVDIDQAGLEQTAIACAALGARHQIARTDIGEQKECIRTVEDAVKTFGRLDVLCNVAGITGPFTNTIDIASDHWRQVMRVNLDGPFYLAQAAIPHLLRSHGNIVNVASSAALVGEAYLVPYATSKAALVHMTRSMAMEFIKQPIRINAVAPGGMLTEMANKVRFQGEIDPELMQRYVGFRGTSQPAEIAELILYLASERACSVHGACFSIDNGISAG
jgi:meso-butanediol dehydrogenase / (S,S)-butanediol dehydrogenase / diacetyl reductase